MNFKRILSKSSLRSTPSSGNGIQSEQLLQLNREIEALKQTVDSLKISVEGRDAAIGTLAREKQKLYVELKATQRTTRDLRQQLVDQREIHSKEKEYLIEEIRRLARKEELEVNSLKHFTNKDQIIACLQDQLLAKDEVICSICAKYLQLKTNKSSLRRRLQWLEMDTQETCENVILLLQDNKMTMDNMLHKILRFSTVSRKSKKYLKLLKMNVKLHYENTQLKISRLRSNRAVDTSETERHEYNEYDSTFSYGSRNKKNDTGEEYKCSSKSLKKILKVNPPKLNYNKRHSPTVTSFYKEHNSQPYYLQETLKKSVSLPTLITTDKYG